MANIKDAIKAQAKGTNDGKGLEAYAVEAHLNKLFHSDKGHLEERAGLHCSAVIKGESAFCYREQVLSLLFKMNQRVNSTGLLKIFAAGNSIHEKWQNMFTIEGVSCGTEERSFSEEYNLLFTPDDKVRLGNKKYVCEIKSQNTYAFKKAKSHPSGETQCLMYMHMTGIPRGFVLTEDKNDQTIKVYIVDYDYKKVLPYLERLHRIQELLDDYNEYGDLPKGLCSACTDKKAMSCSMRDACFKQGMGRIPL